MPVAVPASAGVSPARDVGPHRVAEPVIAARSPAMQKAPANQRAELRSNTVRPAPGSGLASSVGGSTRPPIGNPVVEAAYTVTGPASGEVRSTAVVRVTLGEAVHPARAVRFTPSDSSGDGVFTPASIDLSDSVRSGSFSYTPDRWGKRTITIANDGGLGGSGYMLEFVAKVQLGSSGTAPSGNRGPDLGGFDFFARGPWWRELGRSVLDDRVAADSDALLKGFGAGKVRVDWETTTAHGGNSKYGIPYNVVPGNQPLHPITVGKYASESDPGSVPFYPSMTIEGWESTSGVPPTEAQIKGGGDHHAIVLLRNETTGGIDRLYEYYQVCSDDGGTTWKNLDSGAQFDLTTGARAASSGLRPMRQGCRYCRFWSATTKRHKGRSSTHSASASAPGSAVTVWSGLPATRSIRVTPTTGCPSETHLRLKQSWYDANRATFSPINRAIIDAMRNYGVIVADLANGGFWLNGVNDERWNYDDLLKLRTVPVSAFEVLDTIKPPCRFTGPTAGRAGTLRNSCSNT